MLSCDARGATREAAHAKRGEKFFGRVFVKMRLTIPAAAAAFALAAVAVLGAACGPQDGSAPAANSARQNTTPAASNTGPVGPVAHSTPTAHSTPAAPQSDGVRRVPIAESRAMAERGEAVIYDVRDQRAYEANHVKGAKLVPLDEVEARAAEFPKDKLVITYCA
jgi:hypothetical protein